MGLARTWERGDTPLNPLVLGIVQHGLTLEPVWAALEYEGGSGTAGRMRLVLHLFQAFLVCCCKGLVADREFTSQDWFRFLH
jgi:hypothetical protein